MGAFAKRSDYCASHGQYLVLQEAVGRIVIEEAPQSSNTLVNDRGFVCILSPLLRYVERWSRFRHRFIVSCESSTFFASRASHF